MSCHLVLTPPGSPFISFPSLTFTFAYQNRHTTSLPLLVDEVSCLALTDIMSSSWHQAAVGPVGAILRFVSQRQAECSRIIKKRPLSRIGPVAGHCQQLVSKKQFHQQAHVSPIRTEAVSVMETRGRGQGSGHVSGKERERAVVVMAAIRCRSSSFFRKRLLPSFSTGRVPASSL